MRALNATRSLITIRDNYSIKLDSWLWRQKSSSMKKGKNQNSFHAAVFTSVIQLHFIPNFWWFFSTASLLGASTMQKALFSSLL
jgi:hypothetical protein